MDRQQLAQNQVLLTTFYLGKLVEAGFVESSASALTPTGFDMAMDLVESGFKMSARDFMKTLLGMDCVHETDAESFAILLYEMQERGLKGMLALAAEDGDENTRTATAELVNFAMFGDAAVELLSSIQVQMLSTDVSSEDYNEISNRIGELKDRIINSKSYKR